MIINTKLIKNLKPCKDRFKNWIKYYKNWEGDFELFLDLEKINYKDKLWVIIRLLPRKINKIIALELSKSVLHIYEKKYVNDFRVRNFLEALENKILNNVSIPKNIEIEFRTVRISADVNEFYYAAYAAADNYFAAAAYSAADNYFAEADSANVVVDKIKIIKDVYLKYKDLE